MTETLEYDIIKKTNNITKITETVSIGYSRTEKSYLSEWKAHNAAYSLHIKGNWVDQTRSVDFNR